MQYTPMHTLTTPRLTLRRLTMADTDAYFSRLGSSEAVTRYMLWQPHRSRAESAASIQKALTRYADGTGYRWAITLTGTDTLIGIIDLLRFCEETESCSFAYMLGEAFWNRGYGTEALKAVFSFAFEEMGVKTITADHFAENAASGAVMRKAGMQYSRSIPEKYEKNGVRHTAVEYTITAGQRQQGNP